ncbi:alpha/beta hydrolase [Cupriavidus basilensis]
MPEHWQTLLQAQLPNARSVSPLEHDKLSCAARVAALDAALADIDGPVMLVAHSAGVMITVHWAARHHRKIPRRAAGHACRSRKSDAGWLLRKRRRWMRTAGCPYRASRCPSPASWQQAAMIPRKVRPRAQMASDWGSPA